MLCEICEKSQIFVRKRSVSMVRFDLPSPHGSTGSKNTAEVLQALTLKLPLHFLGSETGEAGARAAEEQIRQVSVRAANSSNEEDKRRILDAIAAGMGWEFPLHIGLHWACGRRFRVSVANWGGENGESGWRTSSVNSSACFAILYEPIPKRFAKAGLQLNKLRCSLLSCNCKTPSKIRNQVREPFGPVR